MNNKNQFQKKNLIVIVFILIAILFFFKNKEAQNSAAKPDLPEVKSETSTIHLAEPNATTPAETLAKNDPSRLKKSLEELKEKAATVRSEAKNSLANAYTAQRSYYAVYNSYTTDIISTGQSFTQPKLNFKMGFLKEFIPKKELSPFGNDPKFEANQSRKSTDSLIGEYFGETTEQYSYSDLTEKISLEDFSKYCKNDCTADNNNFEMILVTPIDETHTDVWLITNNKEMTLVKDSLKEP